jgi:hypothetical protein
MIQKAAQILTLGAALTGVTYAQNRQATITGGGGPDRGKCTIEVVVDGSAQVDIRGNSASLRTLAGQPAQWRRFECSGPMPQNPMGFRFQGIDGRGRQTLMREPRNGGSAVVQIDDSDGGSEGYTFDLIWGAQGPITGGPVGRGGGDRMDQPPPGYGQPDRRDGDEGRYRPGWRNSEYYRRTGRGFAIEEAVRVCQDSIMDQAARRFRTREIHFDNTRIDDNPGRQDWVVGTLDVRRGRQDQRYGFSCAVNFDSGRVRTARLDSRPLR